MANYFPDLTIDENTYKFDHLDPFVMLIKSDMAKKTLRVQFRFTNHCFTEKHDPLTHPEGWPVLHDINGIERTFCPIRYRLSLELPDILKKLADPQTKVFQTAAKRNWAYSLKIEDPEGPFHIFFEIKKTSPKDKAYQDINIVIESAYHETTKPPMLLGDVGFVLLCGRAYCGKPLATRR